MKKFLFFAFFIVIILVISTKSIKNSEQDTHEEEKQVEYDQGIIEYEVSSSDVILSFPLENTTERITKKPFGIFITPENSPIKPERFSGYHTGTDFEIFDSELDADVSVFSICDGSIVDITNIGGYGGVMVQSCLISNTLVNVIYGHISIEETVVFEGGEVEKGEKLTILGKSNSNETDGERKHLHLGIVKGDRVDFRGYVQEKELLSGWIDFEDIMDDLE